MSCLRRVESNQGQQTVHQNVSSGCSTPTVLKIGGVVLGLLLIGGGLAMYFQHVHTIAAYVAVALGGAGITAVVIWSIIDCLRGKNKSNEDLGVQESTLDLNSVGVQEFTWNLRDTGGHPKITEEQVAQLLKNNPNLKQLRVYFSACVSDPDFKALEAHFNLDSGRSTGKIYVYNRKQNIKF